MEKGRIVLTDVAVSQIKICNGWFQGIQNQSLSAVESN